jgi:hypothetical protein
MEVAKFMWKRTCPLCFVRIPWTVALAHSYEIRCPACHAALELSRFTRLFGAFGGIAGAYVAFHVVRRISHGLSWAAPMVVAILAFGIVSALFVVIAGDLVVRAKTATESFPHPAK